MEILGTTQYVHLETQTESWYQLSVINQWDWSKKAVCYREAGNCTIGYVLYKCTKTSNHSFDQELIEVLTDEMKAELINNGYSL